MTEWKKTAETFDFVIVGAGSAGCVLADRLSKQSENRVLLLEAGGGDRSIFIQMPTALSIPMNTEKYNWGFHSEPEPHLGGRRLHCPRGKVLGGSSSINGMVYVRGNAQDYEGWAADGAAGWSYADVLPYFQKAETSTRGGDAYRGNDGPLHTTTGHLKNPLYQAFMNAGVDAGYSRTEDPNGFQQEGFGPMDMTVRRGVRSSTSNAYLKPAISRHNLHVSAGTTVSRILFENGCAVGVVYQQGKNEYRVNVRRDVILSGGPIASPQLLMLSGIGDQKELADIGIDVVHHLPGVGKNLQDHLELYVQQECTQPISLYSSLNPMAKAMIGLRWILTRGGLGATNHFESGAFIRSREGVAWPDIQYHFLPAAMSYDGNSVADGHGFQAHVGPMRSKSRGRVWLTSSDVHEAPKILFNYMSEEDDWREMRQSVRLTREIFAQKSFDPYRGKELAPGADVQSDDEIDSFVRETVQSAYHPCGTCRMGVGADAVVDPQTKVHGVEGLRVVDSSIMPTITTGNLNAPTIMIAEKAADMILGRPALAKSEAPFFKADNYESSQR
ncbi:MAG: choline dehydrogenase [Rhodospirillales bacterium]|nr:choline dehydrogenase [Rhodospirillales bacterium]MBL6942084.1 choline dehydrogenase [Rhodospirillales bacterium]